MTKRNFFALSKLSSILEFSVILSLVPFALAATSLGQDDFGFSQLPPSSQVGQPQRPALLEESPRSAQPEASRQKSFFKTIICLNLNLSLNLSLRIRIVNLPLRKPHDLLFRMTRPFSNCPLRIEFSQRRLALQFNLPRFLSSKGQRFMSPAKSRLPVTYNKSSTQIHCLARSRPERTRCKIATGVSSKLTF